MRASGIYKIVNTETADFYIGSATYIKSRWSRHRCDLRKNIHTNEHLQSSWNKHGENKINFEVVELCEISKLTEREQYYLDLLNPKYNKLKIAKSSLGLKHSQETKEKLRQIFKGRAPSNKGVPRSEETKALLRKAWEKRKLTPISEETKKKISQRLKGKKKTEEHTRKAKEAKRINFLKKQNL